MWSYQEKVYNQESFTWDLQSMLNTLKWNTKYPNKICTDLKEVFNLVSEFTMD